MKGLIIKDCMFLYQQRRFFVLMFLIAIGLSFFTGNAGFASNYCMIIGLILSMSIFTTDELENGYPFLFSLPMTRKMYVQARYIYSAGMLIGTGLLGSVLSLIVNFFMEQKSPWELLASDILLIPAYLICIAVILPILIRYGSQKGRLFLFIVLGFVAGFVMGFFPMLLNPGFLSMIPIWGYIIGGVVLFIAIYLISYRLSLLFIKKREF